MVKYIIIIMAVHTFCLYSAQKVLEQLLLLEQFVAVVKSYMCNFLYKTKKQRHQANRREQINKPIKLHSLLFSSASQHLYGGSSIKLKVCCVSIDYESFKTANHQFTNRIKVENSNVTKDHFSFSAVRSTLPVQLCAWTRVVSVRFLNTGTQKCLLFPHDAVRAGF